MNGQQDEVCSGLVCRFEDLFRRNSIELFKRLEKRAADPNLTVAGAFSIAIELESSEVNAIYCHLTTSLHNSMYLLRRKIVTSFPNHIDDVVAAARKFGVSDDALKKLNRAKQRCS